MTSAHVNCPPFKLPDRDDLSLPIKLVRSRFLPILGSADLAPLMGFPISGNYTGPSSSSSSRPLPDRNDDSRHVFSSVARNASRSFFRKQLGSKPSDSVAPFSVNWKISAEIDSSRRAFIFIRNSRAAIPLSPSDHVADLSLERGIISTVALAFLFAACRRASFLRAR